MSQKRSIDQLGEFALINRIKRFCPTLSQVVVSIGDDAAVLKLNKESYQLITTDMMAEDVHFTRSMPAKLIGHKALACNISDIAAMGGQSTVAVVSLGLPVKTSTVWVEDFYRGMEKIARAFDVSIVGGDTIKSDRIVVNVALLGEVKKKYLVLRSGARAGDCIFVSGLLGGSLKSGRHLNFIPQVKAAEFLVKNFKPTAMMDISDGLAGDLNHILRASHVGANLFDETIPRHKGVSVHQALTDGEDYQLLFTCHPRIAKRLLSWQLKKRCQYFYHIGEIIRDKKKLVQLQGFKHF